MLILTAVILLDSCESTLLFYYYFFFFFLPSTWLAIPIMRLVRSSGTDERSSMSVDDEYGYVEYRFIRPLDGVGSHGRTGAVVRSLGFSTS